MSIGIGGAGSKLASLLDNGDGTIINISDAELDKVDAVRKIRAVVHSPRGQYKGARKDPAIGRSAFPSISDELMQLVGGTVVFSSTGGGTGNGLTSVVLETLSEAPEVQPIDKTTFAFVLPYPEREATEFVDNTIEFLGGPVSTAIDAGNTGNIFLFSNRHKFVERTAEGDYNDQIIASLRIFLAIPDQGDEFHLLDGHIDHEDFSLYQSRPYFNHFARFDFDPDAPFGPQFETHYNPLLLPPAAAIEALFLLEVPDPAQTRSFYGVLDHFAEDRVAPMYGVVHNPSLPTPRITVSVLYSRKPLELVNDFTTISETYKRTRLRKSLDQHVTLEKLHVDLSGEVTKLADEVGSESTDLLDTLKRLGKL